MKGLVVFVAALVALLLAATWGHGRDGAACPAIGYSSSLVVELATDWPADQAHSVTIECDEPCGVPPMDGEEAASTRTAVLAGGEAVVDWFGLGDSVLVTVLDAEGARLAQVDVDLDWVRVGGTEECGGPLEATVNVPAP